MRGRKPKPTTMKLLQGTFRNDRANPDEPKPDIPEVLNAPDWLDAYGREAWDKLVPQLAKSGLFTSLDLLFFAMICADYSVFRRATDCTKDKLTHDTGANGRCALPEIAIARAAFDRVRQGLEPFGAIGPGSRSRLRVQPEENDPIENFRSRLNKLKGAKRFLT